MKRTICFFLASLLCGLASVSATAHETKPFVGKWSFWKENCTFEIELDLYDSPKNGVYGVYMDFAGDGTSMAYHIVEVSSVQGNLADVVVEGSMGKGKASLEYNPVSEEMSLKLPGSAPIVFKQQDKYGFVFISGGDKINVRTAPVSGAPLMQADRGRSFKFLGKEKGWFKVELSATDRRVGYISPEYAVYLKDNAIPAQAFNMDYVNGLTSFTLERDGSQVFMEKTIKYPPQGESLSMPTLEYYGGKVVGNALVFTHFSNMPTMNISEMEKIKPCVVYYWKESGMFIMEGKNYSPEM